MIQELLDTHSEWTNIQDIIKMTFKCVNQTLRVQSGVIRDIEQILPMKADTDEFRAEMGARLNQKANISDIKKTMAEVAGSIESKTSFADVKRLIDSKLDRSELQFSLQTKVSQEEMKNYFD
mmetsp:Transcript_9414/g.14404  ORF Transcript_9414/g.14404 Transcript_9414/m.14404 type:complete len:122 (-) Transcript_9414:1990-2355(-)